MRISWNSQQEPAAYRADAHDFDVLFNGGQTPPKCWYADEEAGEIRCFALNEQGHVFRDPEDPKGNPKSVVYKGKVKIIRKDGG